MKTSEYKHTERVIWNHPGNTSAVRFVVYKEHDKTGPYFTVEMQTANKGIVVSIRKIRPAFERAVQFILADGKEHHG